jgi:TolB-like protein
LSSTSHAVFISYASQDAEAASRICQALRAAGLEVWFDQSELRGGDAWDQKIRREIHDCALFIPIVSQHTQERLEGYFRHEWKLAIERTHHMAEQKPFLVPVVVDGTRDQEAFVPDVFRTVQWTRVPGGEPPPAFVERIKRLLSPELIPLSAVSGAAPGFRDPVRAIWRSKPVLLAMVVVAALAYLVADRLWVSRHPSTSAGDTASRATAELAAGAFAPPPRSIAVLPFVNMSGDATQDYFCDGLTEELLNSLSRISELQVAARTSSFYFRGEHADLSTIAHKLNVASVLEGSVRRSGHTVRITAQLNNTVTGFHVWSKTYDRDLDDVLKLQTEIATAVAVALRVTLLGDEAAKIELGGTRNPAAFDAYLRGSKAFGLGQGASSLQSAIAAYTEAIRLDPNYALALAGRSRALSDYASGYAPESAIHEVYDKAQADARQALKLAAELAEGHLALATYFYKGSLDFAGASEEYESAMTLAPGSAQILIEGARFAVIMGRFDAGLIAGHRAVALDPLSARSRVLLAEALYLARRYEEAVAACEEAISLEPGFKAAYGWRGLAYYGLGDLRRARSSCESRPEHWSSQLCRAITYDKLGRHADAEVALKNLHAQYGDAAAYQYATIYAQWGNTAKALSWLTTAIKAADSGVGYVKVDPLMDPLRNEPRFQAIERELMFPP